MKIENLQQKNLILLIFNKNLIIHTKIKKIKKKKKKNNLTKSIKSILCDYSHACILVTGNITATRNTAATQVIFKNCAPFKDCRKEINDSFVNYADFVNISMHMYNLIEYSDNYSDT